ncbi:hypothetical protein VTN49DRAFT_1231 [Thermomyces lanuginosus]|uniref:uncharacterized protein n=1 Tax=Thermomyces lanuginosus TaxID=5541 RepID=UPI003744558E
MRLITGGCGGFSSWRNRTLFSVHDILFHLVLYDFELLLVIVGLDAPYDFRPVSFYFPFELYVDFPDSVCP